MGALGPGTLKSIALIFLAKVDTLLHPLKQGTLDFLAHPRDRPLIKLLVAQRGIAPGEVAGHADLAQLLGQFACNGNYDDSDFCRNGDFLKHYQ